MEVPSTLRIPGMKTITAAFAAALVLLALAPIVSATDLETRIEVLEAALDHLQRRIEKLEKQQTPRRMTEEEAEAMLRKKRVSDACTDQLGPAPEFAPGLGTKVNPEYMAYLKKHRACMNEKGVQ